MMGWKTLGLGLGVVLVFVGALMATARAFDAAAERETLYRYLDDVLDPVADTEWTHDWEPPQRVLARPITKNDQVILGARIGEAWSAFGVAQKTGETAILADWFGGVALERAQHAAATAHADETRMAMLRRTLRPEFHHLDGSLVQLGSETLTVRYAPDHYDLAQDTFRTTLLRRSTGVARDRARAACQCPCRPARRARGPRRKIRGRELLSGSNALVPVLAGL